MNYNGFSLINKIASLKIIIPAFIVLVLAEILFTAVLMPGFSEATGGLSALDMQAGFSYKEAYAQISAYGQNGIKWYNLFQLVDLLFPIAYGCFFAGSIAALTIHLTRISEIKSAFKGNKANTQNAGTSQVEHSPQGDGPATKRLSVLRFLPLIPAAGAVFDLLENAGIFSMIRIYPNSFKMLANLVMIAGVLKFALLTVSIGILIILGAMLLIRRLFL